MEEGCDVVEGYGPDISAESVWYNDSVNDNDLRYTGHHC